MLIAGLQGHVSVSKRRFFLGLGDPLRYRGRNSLRASTRRMFRRLDRLLGYVAKAAAYG